MPWSWRYEGADGKPVDGPAETFGSQADAESWIGQTLARARRRRAWRRSCSSRTTGSSTG